LAERLERHLPLQALVEADVDLAHPAAADVTDDADVTDRGADEAHASPFSGVAFGEGYAEESTRFCSDSQTGPSRHCGFCNTGGFTASLNLQT
jgi:hypothetical protein